MCKRKMRRKHENELEIPFHEIAISKYFSVHNTSSDTRGVKSEKRAFAILKMSNEGQNVTHPFNIIICDLDEYSKL